MTIKVRSEIVDTKEPVTKNTGTDIDPGMGSKSDDGTDKARSFLLHSN
jgi:hypothetical protein